MRCYNATHTQRFEFHDSDVCYNSPYDLAPPQEPIALPGCVATGGGASQRATCVREGGYLIRGVTYSTFYECVSPARAAPRSSDARPAAAPARTLAYLAAAPRCRHQVPEHRPSGAHAGSYVHVHSRPE